MQLEGLKQLVEAVGWEAALKVVAVWGGKTLYVPDKYTPGHLITRIIGEDAAVKLALTYGGQTVDVPAVKLDHIKLEAKVLRLIDKGFTLSEAGHVLEVSREWLGQIAIKHGLTWKQTRRGGRPRGALNVKKIPGDPGNQGGDGAADPRKVPSAKTAPDSYQPRQGVFDDGGR